MPTRRELLFTGGGAVIGATSVYAGVSALDSGYGSVSWGNDRDEEVWVKTTISSAGGLFTDSDVVYERRYRIFPTRHSRSGDTNIVETGIYDVEVEVATTDRSERSGPFSTRWTPDGCYHQKLIIRVTDDMRVRFTQKTCGG